MVDKDIPLSNIFRFGCDNCATMMVRHSGFQAMLKKDVPNECIIE